MTVFSNPKPIDPFGHWVSLERRIRLVRTLPMWLWRLDSEFRLVEIGENVELVTGIPVRDLIGHQVMDPYGANPVTELGLSTYFETLRARQPFSCFCYERTLLNGARAIFLDSALPIYDEAGAFAGYDGLTFQLSAAIEQAGETASLIHALTSRADALEEELSRRNRELEASNRLLREVLDAMGEGLMVTSGTELSDPDNRIEMLNPAYLEQFALTPDQARPGMRVSELVQVLDARGDATLHPDGFDPINDALARDEVVMMRLPTIGRSLYVRTARRPSGGYVLVHTDVTELEARSEALERARDKADVANAAKSTFLAAMSHEFRTPMNGIVGMTDVLAETALDAEQTGFVETIRNSALSLTALISDILDFSKIEAGQQVLVEETVAPRGLCKDLMALMQPLAQRKGLALNIHFAPEVPEWVKADPLRLRQILLNLIGNAVKFTHSGSVTLSCSGAGPLVFRVEDTGIGIPQAEHAKIFDVFQQVMDGHRREYEGTGLGLAITKRLLSMMGGTITMTSTPGVGSCFCLRVPLVATQAPHHVKPDVPSTSTDVFESMLVLVAEDNRTNQLVTRKILERLGVRVQIVDSGLAAVEAAQNPEIALIFMDIAMPGMDGFDACRAIRASAHRHVPIVALTGNAFEKDREAAMAAGMDGFIAKPVRMDDLRRCLQMHAGGAPARRSAASS